MRDISRKIGLVVIAILLAIMLDTVQAWALNRSPVIKIRTIYDGRGPHYLDKGILVNSYVAPNGEQRTFFKWAKPERPFPQDPPSTTARDVSSTTEATPSSDKVTTEISSAIPSTTSPALPGHLDATARIIRTDGYHEEMTYPRVSWITSREELEAYYSTNQHFYDLGTRENPPGPRQGSFAEAMEDYEASYFETHDLIVVVLEEGSGSVRHELVDIKVEAADGEGEKPYLLRPVIKRKVPEMGTADMAEWHMLIGIDKDYGAAVSALGEPVLR